MGPADTVLEISRGPVAHTWKILRSLVVLGVLAVIVTAAEAEWRIALVVLSPFAAVHVVVAAVNAAALIRGRPQLRATRVGLWFGGGAIVPWSDVTAIYEGGTQRAAFSLQTRAAVHIRFRRRRTLVRLPSWRWLQSWMLDTAQIWLFAMVDPPSAVVARLEALRLAAVSHEDGNPPGAGGIPVARVVRS
jgi:hypothetical protein